MTRTQETGMAIIVTAVIIILLLLTSCTTKKVVTEYVVTHDTLVVSHTDTLRIVSHTSKTDTIREATIQYVTIRQDSDKVDTIKVETIKDHYHTFYVHDSIDTYKAVADSLKHVLDKSKEKTVTKIQIPWKWACFVLVTILAVIVLVSIDKKK